MSKYSKAELTDMIEGLEGLLSHWKIRQRTSYCPAEAYRQAGVFFHIAEEYKAKGQALVDGAKLDIAERDSIDRKVLELSLVVRKLRAERDKGLTRQQVDQIRKLAAKLANRKV